VFRAFVSVALTAGITGFAFVLVAIFYRVPLSAGTLLAIPGLLIVLTASLFLVTIFAHLNTRFRDIAHMATVLLQVAFYATPVIFPAEVLLRRRPDLSFVITLNPMFHLIEVVRHPLLTGTPPPYQSYVAAGLILVVLGIGAAAVIAVFKRRIVFAL
jgi:ABC-type polysaccharide/polyol phosphate export permease